MNKKNFSENFNLSCYTTIKVGGVAEYFAEPRSINEISHLILKTVSTALKVLGMIRALKKNDYWKLKKSSSVRKKQSK